MAVHLQFDRAGMKHILIEGEVESHEDIAYIEELLSGHYIGINNFVITFVDANMLATRLVKALAKCDTNKKIVINVGKAFLYSYLYKLGISCRLVNIKRNNIINTGFSNRDELNKASVMDFLIKIKAAYGYDYTEYQQDSIERRIKICMLRSNILCFDSFKEEVLKNTELFENLFLYFSINTTEFFRDPEVFQELRLKLLPLLDSYPHIKIWSAGCSSGQEPYSLAILLKELGILDKAQIYATDLNPYVIQEAKNGLFSMVDVDKNIHNYEKAMDKDNFFDYFDMNDNYLEIKPEIKRKILFFQHSLVGSGILNEFQLIVCRNVLIYFNCSLQKSIMKNFYNSLDSNGFLILGKSEGILHNEGSKYFKSFNQQKKIFKIK